MSTYATPVPKAQTVIRPALAGLYWKLTAPALGLVALLGFVLGPASLLGGFLTFDTTHNVVHLALAAVAAILGFLVESGATQKVAARVFGVVYLGLAVAGFLSADVFGVGSLVGLHLEVGENLVHLALGAGALYVGFAES